MTKNQWIIIGILALGVLLLYCVGGVLVLNMMTQPVTTATNFQVAASMDTPTSTPAAQSKSSATPSPSPRPTNSSTPQPTVIPTSVAPTVAPTNPIPAAAPVIATAPLVKTATPSATKPVAAQGPIYDAMTKAQTASVYRIDFDWFVKGNIPDLPPGWSTQNGMSLFGISGIVNGKDSDITLKGILAVLFTGDPTKGMRLMTIGDKTYIHGPVPFMGAPEDKWYVSTGNSTMSTSKTSEFSDVFDPQSADLNAFKRTATENLDGRRCDVYTADKAATTKLFQSLNAQEMSSKDMLSQIDSGDAKFWLCDDGYFHQMLVNIEGRTKENPNEKVSFTMKLHLWDFNANLKLTPPANPLPMQNPFLNLATPTKTK